jgi:hypothetical protein
MEEQPTQARDKAARLATLATQVADKLQQEALAPEVASQLPQKPKQGRPQLPPEARKERKEMMSIIMPAALKAQAQAAAESEGRPFYEWVGLAMAARLLKMGPAKMTRPRTVDDYFAFVRREDEIGMGVRTDKGSATVHKTRDSKGYTIRRTNGGKQKKEMSTA